MKAAGAGAGDGAAAGEAQLLALGTEGQAAADRTGIRTGQLAGAAPAAGIGLQQLDVGRSGDGGSHGSEGEKEGGERGQGFF